MLRAIKLSRPIATSCTQIQKRQFSIESYAGKKTFDKLLVANRGEIACRVMKTARLMGIKTVAVYSDADANSKFVHMADEAYNIGPPPSAESYLRIDRILDVCKKSGAQAVHPGYGFLSENSNFSRSLADLGIAFLGPREHSIHAMGDKIESKILARQAKVNTIPGFAGEIKSSDEAIKIAKEIGFPVMIKATAGGGGKGMRIAVDEKDVLDAWRLSRSEAMSSFGDDRMFVEKFVEEPRHIEFQILCDKYGNGVYLPERECSIQRRNQKVLEEAPSTVLDPELRRAMGEQALMMARAVGYESAGTVEFLVDKNKNFYFLEMNTRLQVEHPITEMITGQDLVAHMIAIGAGHTLSITQDDVKINGHALEARVYAEDPYRKYLPSIGRLRQYKEPTGDHVRVDSGILEGSEISMFYDPMVSKTVTWGPDRATALARMRKALDTYVISGVQHNIPLLRTVIDHPRFISGKFTTKFLEEEYPKGFTSADLTDSDAARLAVASAVARMRMHTRNLSVSNREAAPELGTLYFSCDGKERHVCTVSSDFHSETVSVKVNDEVIEATTSWVPGHRTMEIHYGKNDVEFLQIVKEDATGFHILYHGALKKIQLVTALEKELLAHMLPPPKVDTTKFLMSPMPGLIKSVAVKEGDKVMPGQEIVIMEAMKMQNILRSERDAIVTKVLVEVGKKVGVDQILVEFSPIAFQS